MGRHYHVADGCLYIFTTEREMLIDLKVFPAELNLFEAESSWRISPWLAVVEEVLHMTAEKAAIILQLNDYSHAEVPVELLEGYFLDGEDSMLLEAIIEEVRLVASPVIPAGEET